MVCQTFQIKELAALTELAQDIGLPVPTTLIGKHLAPLQLVT